MYYIGQIITSLFIAVSVTKRLLLSGVTRAQPLPNPPGLPPPSQRIRIPDALQDEIHSIQCELQGILYDGVDRGQVAFSSEHFNRIYMNQTTRERIYAQFRRERAVMSINDCQLEMRSQMSKIAHDFNRRYRLTRDDPASATILDLLHILQDLFDVKRLLLIHMQLLNGIPASKTVRMHPKFEQHFDAPYACEANMLKTAPIAFDRLVTLTIRKSVEVGLTSNYFQLDKSDLLKYIGVFTSTSSCLPRCC